ncbi:MAG: hypothetical protein S4CHLAM123_09490 [Chlamydiales bacterium]|nr:hypothetical protein [Chlamydiales bacterium]
MPFQIPDRFLPLQYVFRASEAKKILSVTEQTPEQTASKIALAELVQVIFFVTQLVFYTLAFCNVISPLAAGGVIMALLPLEAACSYHTFVHYKTFSRVIFTLSAVAALGSCAGLAIGGIVTDSALTLCCGGITLHVFRNLSEYIDSRQLRKNPTYMEQIYQSAH